MLIDYSNELATPVVEANGLTHIFTPENIMECLIKEE